MLKVTDLKKVYVTERGALEAVRGVGFEVNEGEIFTLLGPSGCGKSTTLRCIAGLEVPDVGSIELGDHVVFSSRDRVNVPTFRRGVGMVFQSYAIWPHMTVFENVAFPLRFGPGRLPSREIPERVRRALTRVQMEGMADRPAPLLSGGQQQRVALARALVYQPSVLLLDEPLSNLDAKLRLGMRAELQELIKELKVTALYVTHDQEEALALSDRIAVMQDGEVHQEGTPREVYMTPANSYVAGFVGKMNFFGGRVGAMQENGTVSIDCDFGKVAYRLSGHALAPQQKVWVTIRPEEVVLHPESGEGLPNLFPAKVTRTVFVGSRTQCELKIGSQTCETEVDGARTLPVGTNVKLELPPHKIRVLV